MKAFWKYTLARLALFVVTYVVIWAVVNAVRPLPYLDPFILLAAIIASGVISLFVLRTLRENFASRISQRAERMTQRVEESRSADDVD